MVGVVADMAASLGASEAALRLILGQMLGAPLMVVYRSMVAHREATAQHLFLFLTGALAGHWVIGPDVAHSFYAVFGTYLILLCAGGTLTSVILSFVFNFGYLLVGYVFTETEGYDICWTMPHCVLCLKLIGLTFDCYDGDRARRLGEGVLSKDQRQTFLLEQPTVLEMLSHSFFIGGYFVGPQISLRKYREFVSPTYSASLPASPNAYGLKRLGLALCYMVVQVVGSMYLPSNWPASQAFADLSLLSRLLLLPLWVKVILSKYIFAWLCAETVCVLSGLSYVEQRADGSVDWRGCANVKVYRLETATSFGNIIESFNVNTNHWVAVYIFKRLKFLGNKLVSQAVTLLFLAVWHGFHFGYYLTFLNEFMTVLVEREFLGVWAKSPVVTAWRRHPAFPRASAALGWCWVWLFLPHCFIPFSLLMWDASLAAYKSTWFLMYLVYAAWWIGGKGLLKKALRGHVKEKVDVPVEDEKEKEVEVKDNVVETEEVKETYEKTEVESDESTIVKSTTAGEVQSVDDMSLVEEEVVKREGEE